MAAKQNVLCCFIWTIIVLLGRSHGMTFEKHMEILMNRDGYLKTEPPNTEKATEVRIGLYINSIKLNNEKMTMELNLYLRQAWQDPRLQFDRDDIIITGSHTEYRYFDIGNLWLPDLFYRNSIEVKTMGAEAQNKLLKINATGHVWFVEHQKVTLSCPMTFHKFPFATQSCPIMFESFGYTMDVLYWSWLDNPIDIDPSLQLPRYTLLETILYDCSQNYTAGAFPCLEVRLVLVHDVGLFILWVVVPSVLVVTMSWLIFWTDAEKLGTRLLLGFTLELLLLIISLISATTLSHAHVSYITAADIWSMVCLLFIFGVMLESTIVKALCASRHSKEEELERHAGKPRVDRLCRIVFPVCFVLFIAIFFGMYQA